MWRDKKKIKNNNFVASDLHLSLLFLFFAIFPFVCLYTAKHFRVSTKCLLESTCACNFYVNEYFLYEINFFPSNVSGVTVLAKKKSVTKLKKFMLHSDKNEWMNKNYVTAKTTTQENNKKHNAVYSRNPWRFCCCHCVYLKKNGRW